MFDYQNATDNSLVGTHARGARPISGDIADDEQAVGGNSHVNSDFHCVNDVVRPRFAQFV
jgi:hypothetical protein